MGLVFSYDIRRCSLGLVSAVIELDVDYECRSHDQTNHWHYLCLYDLFYVRIYHISETQVFAAGICDKIFNELFNLRFIHIKEGCCCIVCFSNISLNGKKFVFPYNV